MPSSLELALNELLANNYVTLAVLTAVGYDYILTFSKEVEYVWRRPWTQVSTLFVVVRYTGLPSVILISMVGSSFLPGPAKASHYNGYLPHSCKAITIISSSMSVLFSVAADLVMILRVWAMYNRSKLILYTLFALYTAEVVFTIVALILSNPAKNLSVTTVQITNFSFCTLQAITFVWIQVSFYWQIVVGAAICILATIQFVRQSLQMYAETKQWQLDQYMNLLVKEGILYFFVFLISGTINLLFATGKIPTQYWQTSLLYIIEYVPMYTLTPRFVMNIRELYARGGHVDGIDTGFGLVSVSNDVGGGIVFADEDAEEIPMEALNQDRRTSRDVLPYAVAHM